MWSFEVLANVTSMFSLYCNSTKNGNNHITMILTLDDICINVKILNSSFRSGKGETFLSNALNVVLLKKPNILAISPRNSSTVPLTHFTVTPLEVSSYVTTTSVKSQCVYHIYHYLIISRLNTKFLSPLIWNVNFHRILSFTYVVPSMWLIYFS